MERIMEAELWTLLMLDESTQELYYAIAAGGEQDALKDLRVKVGEGVAGWVVEHGETLIVPEAVDDPLHVLEDGAQNGIQVEARGKRARQLVEDKQICERDTPFRLIIHWRTKRGGLSNILSHQASIADNSWLMEVN